MGLFSGDGVGCSARLFKKYGAKVLGGLHIKMPDCIGDVKLLKKSLDENRKIVMKADEKIEIAAKQMLNGKYPKNGLRFVNRLIGSERCLLIDTGLGICNIYDEVRKLTDKHVIAIATHIHWDYIGGHKYFPDFRATESARQATSRRRDI